MEHNNMKKGQASVEFLLTIMIAVLYLTMITIPTSDQSSKNIEDVSNISKLAVSAEKLSNTIQYVSLSGEGTKQTIQVIVPTNGTMECIDSNIKIEYSTDSMQLKDTYDKIFKTGATLTCDPRPSSGSMYFVEVEKKTGGGVYATFNLIST